MRLSMLLEWNNRSYELLPFAILFLVLLTLLLALWKRNLSWLICFVLFSVYLLVLLALTFFPLQINGDYVREQPFMDWVNWKPFYFGPFYNSRAAWLGMIDNIYLMIPFGFGLSFILPLKGRHFLWIIPLAGMSIEAGQLAISIVLRYPFRVIDINDVLMNTLGVLIGYLAFRIFSWIYCGIIQLFRLQPRGLLDYFYEVARLA